MKSYYVCHFCTKAIYRGGVEVSPKVGNGYSHGIWYAHKGCLRKAVRNDNLMSNVFRMLRHTSEFIKVAAGENKIY